MFKNCRTWGMALVATGVNAVAPALRALRIPAKEIHVLRPGFWHRYELSELNPREWEALCDGCGLCCLLKFWTEDDEIAYTNVHCRLLDCSTCRCRHYPARKKIVPDCIKLTPGSVREHAPNMPSSCAYRLRLEGKPLHDWHHLVSGSRETVDKAGVSIKNRGICETTIAPDRLAEHTIETP
ncbi:MAG: YcgN family cysteine cluster protein [Rhodobacteraceae bacterium]|nr:YcgN family cysteine cluster protein [Paracoccaceae bacterium]